MEIYRTAHLLILIILWPINKLKKIKQIYPMSSVLELFRTEDNIN